MIRLLSSITRAITNLRQSWLICSITIAIISICLFLVGGYFLLTDNLASILENLKGEIRITAYLRDGFPEEDINELQDRISAMPEVATVAFISKNQALEEFQVMLEGEDDIIGGLAVNPLPASMRVDPKPQWRNMAGIRTILTSIGDDPLVADIHFGKDWLDRLENLMEFLDIGAIAMGIILSLAAIFIISNTIKITVMARKDELEIMRLVGATEGFIRLPFLIEGIIQGLAGAVISLGMLIILHNIVQTRFQETLLRVFRYESLSFLPTYFIVTIIAGGMVIGGIGSLASVGRFSK